MIFNPKDRNKVIIVPRFQTLSLDLRSYTSSLNSSIYRPHDYDLTDDVDIQREIRNMFVRANILARRFLKCSTSVKVVLFRAYCISFYDVSLWKFYKEGSLRKLSSCYNKCRL
jgi:hypothetical protein